MSFGNFYSLGILPYEGSIFPYGFHNLIPNSLRPYWPTIPKTNIPLPHIGNDWGNYPVYPLGMKALPNRQFTSLNRQMYRAIVDLDFNKIDRIANSQDFDINKDVVLPDFEYTALGMAASLNLIEVVHYLTKRGVDFEHKIGPFEKTALHIAVESGNELLAKFLLNNGADINAKDKFGLTVYDKAEFRGFYDYKSFFDYYKQNPKKRNIIDYEEYKYTREIILEDIDTINFKPSQLLEFSMANKLNPSNEHEKINLNKFDFFLFNQYNMQRIEKGAPEISRKSYDSLYYFTNNIKF